MVQLTIYVKDMRAKERIEDVLTSFYPKKNNYPTVNMVQVCGLAVEGALVSVQAIASCGEGSGWGGDPDPPKPHQGAWYRSGKKGTTEAADDDTATEAAATKAE